MGFLDVVRGQGGARTRAESVGSLCRGADRSRRKYNTDQYAKYQPLARLHQLHRLYLPPRMAPCARDALETPGSARRRNRSRTGRGDQAMRWVENTSSSAAATC